MSTSPKHRRLAFTFDESSLVSLETLKARGIAFDEFPCIGTDGVTNTLVVPRLALWGREERPLMPWTAMYRSAALSPCGQYRWWLQRRWGPGDGEVVCFLMLNPSTADAEVDDPTIRRCIGFARTWGYSILSVRNLFCYRATDPRALLTAADPVGGRQGNAELLAACTADLTVAAWGASVPFGRDAIALALIATAFPEKQLWCLGRTKAGKPRHPLYVKASQRLELF